MARSASGAVADGCAGYCGLALACPYLDALGVRFGRLGHQDLQNAVLGRGFDSVGLHVAGQGDRPAERAVAALGPVDLLAGRVGSWVPLALDGQQAVLEGDLQVIVPDAGQFRGHQVGVLALGDVDRGCPRLAGGAGAGLLAEVASRIRKCVREMDTVSRFGGDEFVVILTELAEDKAKSRKEAGVIAEKIRISLAQPYRLTAQHEKSGVKFTIDHDCTSSIGCAVFLDHEASYSDILRWADMAMYEAKDAGGNTIRFHND